CSSDLCNVLYVFIGDYCDDSGGISDYKVYYKVKRGKVYSIDTKQKDARGQNYRFRKFKLTPLTEHAFVVVIKESIGKPIYKKIWHVNLFKEAKRSALKEASIKE
ncbi:MAG: hypothetical protein HGA85_03925, partial [Nanoarchaeota archaeon]|nr:hypothetical protein [Nanoarchaeota archaeon]